MAISFAETDFPTKLREDAATRKASACNQGLKGKATKRADLLKVNPYLLTIEKGFNLRTVPDEEADEELYQYIVEKGVASLPPIVAYSNNKGQHIVVDGHRRLTAIKRAIEEGGQQIELVNVQAEAPGFNPYTRLAAVVRYNQGSQLKDRDKAAFVLKALGWNWDAAQIQRESGITVAQQSRLIKLLSVSDEANQFVKTDEVSTSFVTDVFDKAETPEQATEIITAAVEVARSQGKKRATAKHIPEHLRITPKKVKAKDFLLRIEADGRVDRSKEDIVVIALTTEEYAELKGTK